MTETVGPFILGKTLGEGSSGKVKLGIHKTTGQKVAIKILKKSSLTSKPALRRKVEREIAVMKLIDHPHVLTLFDVLQTNRYLFLILELVEGGELFEYLVRKGRLSLSEAFHFFRQIIEGVEYCHSLLICHRDLKPENLLLDSKNNIKIADFGMASFLKEDEFLLTSCGSPHYASPEVVRGERYNGMKADAWSCGVILFALVSGRLPFDDENLHRLLAKVKAGRYILPDFLPADVKDLIKRMLTLDPRKRIKVSEVKSHPWWIKMCNQMPPSIASNHPPPKPLTEAERTQYTLELRDDSGNNQIVDEQAGQQQQPQQQQPVVEQAPEQAAVVPVPSDATAVPSDVCEHQQNDAIGEEDSNEGEEIDQQMTMPPEAIAAAAIAAEEEDQEAAKIETIDEEVLQTIQNMGWKDEEKLRLALLDNTQNLEKVLYLLLLKKKGAAINEHAQTFSALSVSPANPIKFEEDDAMEGESSGSSSSNVMLGSSPKASSPAGSYMPGGRRSISSSPPSVSGAAKPQKKSWFSFWRRNKKEDEERNIAFGLHSSKTHSEIIAEVSRAFQVLKIHSRLINDHNINAHNVDNSIEFDITLKSLEGGFLLQFSRSAGDHASSRALFDALQQELQL